MPVGQELAQARIVLGLSVDEVAQRTRIRAANIKRIDQDDFKKLGADVYVSGWIRSYAEAVGLDPAAMVAKYRSENPIVAVTPESQTELLPGSPLNSYTNRKVKITKEEVDVLPAAPVRVLERKAPKERTNWSMVLAAVFAGLLVIGGLALIGRLVVGGGGSEVVIADETVAEQTEVVVAEDADAQSPTGELTAAIPGAPVQLVVRVESGRSWVRVSDIADVEIFEGILTAG
ncbi:MAG: hypothetical protein FJW50_02275, partial [Actinobacteria bacterium]|nr:hypothetical protein [Actinomycetota bacterium]